MSGGRTSYALQRVEVRRNSHLYDISNYSVGMQNVRFMQHGDAPEPKSEKGIKNPRAQKIRGEILDLKNFDGCASIDFMAKLPEIQPTYIHHLP